MRLWIAAMLAMIAAACSPLAMFNTVAPKDGLAAAPVRAIAYGAGPRQKLDVYPAPPGARRPVVVFVYGGGWDSGRRQDYEWAGRAFAAKGFVTVVPDYRLVPEVRFPAFLEDGAASVRWVRDNIDRHGGDPDRIVLVGHSAGAYNVAMLGLDRRWLEGAGVPLTAIRGVVGLAGPYDFYPWDTEASRNAFGQSAEPLQTQPVTFARPDAPPLLLLHGDIDATVRVRNTRRLEAKVLEAGGRVESKIYEGVDHRGIVLALSRPLRGRAATLEDATAFARRVTESGGGK
jgi:acetyl esterase/lipase